MKRIISTFLMIVFMLSISISVFGAGATSGKCGENATWNYDTYTCTLTISGSGNLNDYTLYTEDEAPWYDYRKNIRTVIIEKGITSIGDYNFKQYYSLSNITIPGTVKSIGSNAFYGCKALTNVDIPEGVTTLESEAFTYCENLMTVSLPKSLRVIENGVFSCCNKLQNVELPRKLETLGSYAFVSCYGITSVVIPDGITEIGSSCFSNCTNLQNITIPKSVTKIGNSAFYECRSLSEIKFMGSQNQWNSIMFEEYNENLQYGNIKYGGGFPLLPIIIIGLIVAIAFALIKSKKVDVSKAKEIVNDVKKTVNEKNVIPNLKVEHKKEPIIEKPIEREILKADIDKPKTGVPKTTEAPKGDWFKSAGDL